MVNLSFGFLTYRVFVTLATVAIDTVMGPYQQQCLTDS